MPRAALLSIHARVEKASVSSWEAPGLIQIWGPRYSTYVVAARDLAVFTLGRMPEDGPLRRRAEDLASRLHARLDGARMAEGLAARAIGERPSLLRYATLTGRVAIRKGSSHARWRGPSLSKAKPSPAWPISTSPPSTSRHAASPLEPEGAGPPCA